MSTTRYRPGVDQIPQYADERLTAELVGRCLYCGSGFGGEVVRSADHVPSKVLLRKPYPVNLPTVPACVKCNNGFSGDEQYVRVFLGCVIAGSADPDAQSDSGVRATLARSPALHAQMEAAMRDTLPGEPVMWQPDHVRVCNVLVKNARGHLWLEHAELRRNPPDVRYAALEALTDEERATFENPPDVKHGVLPEVGSRALARVFSGDWFDGWTYVQDDQYRFAIDHLDGDTLRVRLVVAEYLAAEVIWRGEGHSGR